MNTDAGLPPVEPPTASGQTSQPPPPDSGTLFASRTTDKAAQALAAVEAENAEVKDDRKEERFLWVCACMVLFDCAVMMNANNFAAPLVVGILELVALIVLARRLGVEEVRELVYGIIDRIRKARD